MVTIGTQTSVALEINICQERTYQRIILNTKSNYLKVKTTSKFTTIFPELTYKLTKFVEK